MRKRLGLLLKMLGVMTFASSCVVGKVQNQETGKAGLTSIKMKVPEKSTFASSPELQAKLTGVQVTVTPTGEKCTTVEPATLAWKDSTELNIDNMRVLRGCAYAFKIEIGTLDKKTSRLDPAAVFYAGEASIKPEDIGDKDAVDLIVKVRLTDAGRAGGFTVGDVETKAGSTDVTIGVEIDTASTSKKSEAQKMLENGQELKKQGILSLSKFRTNENGIYDAEILVNEGSDPYSLSFAIAYEQTSCQAPTMIALSNYKDIDALIAAKKKASITLKKIKCTVNGSNYSYVGATYITEAN
jgi:hypothetical protein